MFLIGVSIFWLFFTLCKASDAALVEKHVAVGRASYLSLCKSFCVAVVHDTQWLAACASFQKTVPVLLKGVARVFAVPLVRVF